MLPRARGGTYAAAVAVAAGINSLTMPIYSRSPDGHIMGADGKPEWGRPKFVNTRRRGAMPPLRVAFPSGWAEDALEVHCWRDAGSQFDFSVEGTADRRSNATPVLLGGKAPTVLPSSRYR